MLRTLTTGLAVLVALTSAAPARAQPGTDRPVSEARVPNFLGTTGLLLTPSAYVQRDAQASAHFVGGADFLGGGALLGVGNRLEVGLTFLDLDSRFAPADEAFLLNAKLNLLQETLLWPGFSVGVVDALDELNKDPSWYVVLSKQVGTYFLRALTGSDAALTFHLGYGGGIYEDELFGGTELFFTPSVSALAEIQGGQFNLGGRLHYRGVRATVGLLDFERLDASLSYSITFR